LISECYQEIANGEESRNIEKSQRSAGPRLREPIETKVEKLAMERIERRTEDLRRKARCVRSPLTIRMEEIERLHGRQIFLR
jgi:hypothetical protein